LGQKGGEAIASALAINTKLKMLWIGRNKIGEKATALICEALKTNTNLKSLLYEDMRFSSKEITISFAELIKTNKNITELDIGRNDIKGSNLKIIMEAIKTNSAITNLSLSIQNRNSINLC